VKSSFVETGVDIETAMVVGSTSGDMSEPEVRIKDPAVFVDAVPSGLYESELLNSAKLVEDSAHGKLEAVDIQAGTVAHVVSGVPVNMLAIGSEVEYRSPVGTSEYGVVDRLLDHGDSNAKVVKRLTEDAVSKLKVTASMTVAVPENSLFVSASRDSDETKLVWVACVLMKMVVDMAVIKSVKEGDIIPSVVWTGRVD
jgi:hypothetical protein